MTAEQDAKLDIIKPLWNLPTHVIAGVTTRGRDDNSGHSETPFERFNLAQHVGDQPTLVEQNRQLLANAELAEWNESQVALETNQNLQARPRWQWLNQTHSTDIAIIESVCSSPLSADAAISSQKNTACTVLTADCLPILMCDADGTRVAAVHAGWRGLANGIVAKSIAAFCQPNNQQEISRNKIYAWLGPAIGPDHFEVGDDVRSAFITGDIQPKAQAEQYAAAFRNKGCNKYLADIYQLATIALSAAGVHHIYGGGFCTVSEEQRFFSYRRDGICGRMASFIYLAK